MEEQITKSAIDWKGILSTTLANWKKLFLIGAGTFVVVAALSLCVPNVYDTTVKLSPEVSKKGGSSMGSLASLASSMGFDLSAMSSSEGLYPTMYPDVIQSPDFAVGLFGVTVKTKKGDFEGPFYDYLVFHQKKPFWVKAQAAVSEAIGSVIGAVLGKEKKEKKPYNPTDIDAFQLTIGQKKVADAIRKNITCTADKKAGILTLNVTSQDPLVCGMMADSVRAHLQAFITDYHTRKSSEDAAYYKALMDSAQVVYDVACAEYFKYVEEHSGLSMERFKVQQQKLENDMQLKYNVYLAFQKNYLNAEAQIQSNKPAFVVLQAPAVPTKKTKPSRAKVTLGLTIFAVLGAAVWFSRDKIEWKELLS